MDPPPPGVGGSKPKLGDLRIYARNLGDLRGMFKRCFWKYIKALPRGPGEQGGGLRSSPPAEKSS